MNFPLVFIDETRDLFAQAIERARAKVTDPELLVDKVFQDAEFSFTWYWQLMGGTNFRGFTRVFDIATGAGYLMWMLREAKGCDVFGNDVKSEYGVIWRELGIADRVSIHQIEPFKPAICRGTYDYVVATAIMFNRIDGNKANLWGVEEWKFFFFNACAHLTYNGEIYLCFNNKADELPTGELLDFLERVGQSEGKGRFRVTRRSFLQLHFHAH